MFEVDDWISTYAQTNEFLCFLAISRHKHKSHELYNRPDLVFLYNKKLHGFLDYAYLLGYDVVDANRQTSRKVDLFIER